MPTKTVLPAKDASLIMLVVQGNPPDEERRRMMHEASKPAREIIRYLTGERSDLPEELRSVADDIGRWLDVPRPRSVSTS